MSGLGAITPGRLKELLAAEEMLNALRGAGVDNWDGYDDAMEAMEMPPMHRQTRLVGGPLDGNVHELEGQHMPAAVRLEGHWYRLIGDGTAVHENRQADSDCQQTDTKPSKQRERADKVARAIWLEIATAEQRLIHEGGPEYAGGEIIARALAEFARAEVANCNPTHTLEYQRLQTENSTLRAKLAEQKKKTKGQAKGIRRLKSLLGKLYANHDKSVAQMRPRIQELKAQLAECQEVLKVMEDLYPGMVDTYCGGYTCPDEEDELAAFRHGMATGARVAGHCASKALVKLRARGAEGVSEAKASQSGA